MEIINDIEDKLKIIKDRRVYYENTLEALEEKKKEVNVQSTLLADFLSEINKLIRTLTYKKNNLKKSEKELNDKYVKIKKTAEELLKSAKTTTANQIGEIRESHILSMEPKTFIIERFNPIRKKKLNIHLNDEVEIRDISNIDITFQNIIENISDISNIIPSDISNNIIDIDISDNTVSK